MLVLRDVFKYCNLRSKLLLTNSLIISIFRYGAPLLLNANMAHIDKLHTLIMKNTRPILGISSYKLNTRTIMEKLKWCTMHQIIMSESLKFIHKIYFEHLPPSMTRYITFGLNNENNTRLCRKPSIINRPRSERMSQSIFHRSVYLFNKLDYGDRIMNTKKFAKNINCIVKDHFPMKKRYSYRKTVKSSKNKRNNNKRCF